MNSTNEKQFDDYFPDRSELNIDVIEHHAKMHNLSASDELISFAGAIWAECKTKFEIVNIMDGFQNSYNQEVYQVWAITKFDQRILCGLFYTQQQAKQYIRECKNDD